MSHFYTKTGEARHEVTGKNGKLRPTTIADARANGWLGSVSTVLDTLAKPSLDGWKMSQVAIAARQLCEAGEKLPDDEREWCETCKARAFEQVDEAADYGTRLHDAIERFWNSPETAEPDLEPTLRATKNFLAYEKITLIEQEIAVVHAALGYAGKTDAVYKRESDDGKTLTGILDFKTRRTKPGQKIIPIDSHATQIAAYLAARNQPFEEGCNVYISTTEPGRLEAFYYDAAKLAEEMKVFEAALTVWKIRNRYFPGEKQA